MKNFKKKMLLFLLLFSISLSSIPVHAAKSTQKTNPNSQCDFQKEEMKLWIDHVSWTRSYITSAIASLKDKDAVLERLLKNQDEIGNSIKPFYGEEAGNKLATLL